MKHNYLNNKDILREIHNSKTTYCTFSDPADQMYDLIVYSKHDINEDNIALAKKNRAARIGRAAHVLANKGIIIPKDKKKYAAYTIDTASIKNNELVFRVMTWEHIPLAPPKVPIKKTSTVFDITPAPIPNFKKYVKVKFPPFFHYRISEKNEIYVVGKSHWQGTLEDGVFNTEHGKISDTLANMFIKLCERFATRYNWRNYTYNEEMKGQALLQLIQVGLKFDEAKSDNPFCYLTVIIDRAFIKVLLIEKRVQATRDDILEHNGLAPSYSRQTQTQIKCNETEPTCRELYSTPVSGNVINL